MEGFEDFSEIIDSPGEDGLFFPAAGRQKAVESLRHFAEYGSMLLFLRGAPGSGRTTVLDKFALSVDPDTQVVRASVGDGDIIASLARKVDQLSFEFEQVVEKLASSGFDDQSESVEHAGETSARADEDDWVPSPRTALVKYLRSTSARGRRVIAVLDDCQALNDEDLTTLVELAEQFEGVFKLVFSGDDALADRVGDFSEREAVLINFIDLSEFSLEDAEAYVDYRLQAAGYVDEKPFRREHIANALQRSEGSLPKFHQLLSGIPIKPAVSARRPLIPLPHLLASLLLLVLIGLLLFLDDEKPLQEDPAPIVLQKLEPEAAPDTQATASSVPDDETSRSASDEADPEAESLADLQSPDDQIVVDTEPEKTAAAVIVASRTDTESKAQSQQASSDADSANTDDAVAARETRPEPVVESPPPATVASADGVSGQGANSTHNRLLSWPETGYALQVFGTHNQLRAEELVARYLGKADLLFYETRHNGKPWFVVVTGPYSGSQAARRGIADLGPI